MGEWFARGFLGESFSCVFSHISKLIDINLYFYTEHLGDQGANEEQPGYEEPRALASAALSASSGFSGEQLPLVGPQFSNL